MNRKMYLAFKQDHWYAREHYPEYDEHGEMRVRERWHSLGIKGKHKRAAALKALEAIRQRVVPGQAVIQGDVLFSQFAAQYLSSVRLSVRPKTLESYEMWLRAFESGFGCIPLRHITPSLIDRWKIQLAEHYSPSSVNMALRTVRVAFSYAQKHGLISIHPFNPIGKLDVPKHDFPPFWTRQQFDTFLENVTVQRQRTAFALAFFAGLRLGEVVSLRWEDLREDYIVVESRTEHRTKSDRSRKVPLFSSLRREIENTPRRGEFVITPVKKSRSSAEPNNISQRFREHVKAYNETAADPLPAISFHGLRHSFATNLAPKVPVAVLQKLLGHGDIKTTMIYIHVQADVALDAISHIDM